MLVRQVHVLAYTRHDDTCPLGFGFLHHDAAHDARIVVVEMTDGLVGKDEVEWLTERTYHGHTLLLTERHATYLGIYLVCDAQHVKPLQYLFAALEARKAVLYLYILHCRQFGEKAKFLEEMGYVAHAHLYPVGTLVELGVFSIEHYLAAIVMAIPYYVTAECTLALAAFCLYKIEMAFVENGLLLPHFRHEVGTTFENLWQNRLKTDCLHFYVSIGVF